MSSFNNVKQDLGVSDQHKPKADNRANIVRPRASFALTHGLQLRPKPNSVNDGVIRDRMMSVHAPEMRHGRKSSSRRFDGHKAEIVVDTGSQLITFVEVLPGNSPDNSGSLELVEQSETNTGVPVEEAMGDAAYGDGDTRQAFADAGRTLVGAKAGFPADTGGESSVGSAFRTGTIHSALDFVPARLGQILTPVLLTSASLPKCISLDKAFRPYF